MLRPETPFRIFSPSAYYPFRQYFLEVISSIKRNYFVRLTMPDSVSLKTIVMETQPQIAGSQQTNTAPATTDVASFTTNWTSSRSVGPSASACLSDHCVWYCSGDKLYGFDQFTGEEQYCLTGFGARTTSTVFVQPYDDGLLVACDDAGLYYIELSVAAPVPVKIATIDDGGDHPGHHDQPLWMEALNGSVYLYSGDGHLFRMPPKSESADKIVWGEKPGSGCYPSLGTDGVYLTKGKELWVYDLQLLMKKHSLKLEHSGCGSIRTTSTAPVYCVVLNSGKLFNIVCGISGGAHPKVLWTTTFEVSLSSTGVLVSDALYCYIPLVSGSLVVLDVLTGKQATFNKKNVGPYSLGTIILGKSIMQESILYMAYAQDGVSGGFVYAINLNTGVIASMHTDPGPQLIGVDNGVLYYSDLTPESEAERNIHAVRLSDLVREFYAESILMQNMEFTGHTDELGAVPVKSASIATEITLFDVSGTPRLGQYLRLGATEPAVIQCEGVEYRVGPSQFADLITDASGRMRITVKPGYTDSSGAFHDGLTFPGLTLYSTFMDKDLSMLIRPDAQLHDVLTGITAATLTNGIDFNGNPVVMDDYRKDDTIMKDVADSIKTTAMMVKASIAHKNKRMESRYLAGGCNMDTICCCATGDFHCPVVCSNNYAFDLGGAAGGQTYFKDQLNEAGIQEWLRQHPVTTHLVPMSFGDFWDSIKSGAAAVTDAIVYAADKVLARVTAIINKVKHTIDLVIDTLGKAMLVAQGIFNTIARGIDKVKEMLSFYFDWQDILAMKDILKGQVNSAVSKLLDPQEHGEPSVFDQMKGKGVEMFAKLNETVQKNLTDLEKEYGAYTGKVAREDAERAAGIANSAAGSVKSNWLLYNVMDQLLSKRILTADKLNVEMSGLPFGYLIPDLTVPDSLKEEIQKLFGDLEHKVTDDIKATIREVQAGLTENAGNLFSATVKFFIGIVKGAARVTIDVVSGLFEAMMAILKALLKMVDAYLTQKIEIPFVSDLYRFITRPDKNSKGSDLTVADFVCLLLAIPTQLITKATAGITAVPNKVAAILSIASGAGQELWALFNAQLGGTKLLMDRGKMVLGKIGKPIYKIAQLIGIVVIGGVVRSLLFLVEFFANAENPTALAYDTLLWAVTTLGVFVDVIVMSVFAYTKFIPDEGRTAINAVLGLFMGLSGLFILGYVSNVSTTSNPLGVLFSFLGFAAISMRPGVLIGTPRSRGICIGTAWAFTSGTAAIKLYTGIKAYKALKESNAVMSEMN